MRKFAKEKAATILSYEPLGTCVVVLADKQPATDGAIVLPDYSKPEPTSGIVVAVGPGSLTESGDFRRPLQVEVNDRVHFQPHASRGVKIDGVEYLVMDEADILLRKGS